MNWQSIKEKYPQAFKAYLMPILTQKLRENYDALVVEKNPNTTQYFFGSVVLREMCAIPYHRLLYDFFDRFQIIVSSSRATANVIHFKVVDGKAQIIEEFQTQKYRTRIEAEFEAFDKAFLILENKMPELLKTISKPT